MLYCKFAMSYYDDILHVVMACGRITIGTQFVVTFDFVLELVSLGNVMCCFIFSIP